MLNNAKSATGGRKLKLQMHMSLDGIVGGSEEATGALWDEELREHSISNLKDVDTILLGSNTAPDLITYWSKVAKDTSDEDYELGKRITEIPKVVFSHNTTASTWPNTTMANGLLKKEVERLKNMQGKEMLVYGGAGFVSSLIRENLIDEYDLLVHPEAVGNGLGIFQDLPHALRLKLLESRAFSCGIILLRYLKKEKENS